MYYKCDNCGAIMDRLVSECPYCGSMNYEGSIHEYNEELEDIRENLEDIPQQQKQDYYETIHKEKNKVFKYIFNTIIFLVIGVGVYFMVNSLFFNDSYDFDQEVYLEWQNENYTQLDTWLLALDFDALFDFRDELYSKDSDEAISAFYNWEGSMFVSVYNDILYLDETYLNLGEEEVIDYFLGMYLYEYYWCLDSLESGLYTEEQEEVLSACILSFESYLSKYFSITSTQLEEWKSEAYEYGVLEWYACDVIIDTYIGGNEE